MSEADYPAENTAAIEDSLKSLLDKVYYQCFLFLIY